MRSRFDRWQVNLGASGRKWLVLPPQAAESGMPRYFFDIHDGSGFLRDTVGSQLDGAAQVRYEAMQALPAIARDEIPKDGDKQSFMVLVRDENNLVVYTATLAFVGLWLGDVPPPPPEEE